MQFTTFDLAALKKQCFTSYEPEVWMKQSAVLNSSEKSTDAFRSNLYRFYQSASIHRQFVLRELLPENKLVVA